MPDVTNPFMPTLMTMLMAYACAYSVMAVYDKAVDTILLCVLVDEKANAGVQQFYCPPKISEHLEHAEKRAFRYQKAMHTGQLGEGVAAATGGGPVVGSGAVAHTRHGDVV
jgi:hypothetical protein